MTQKSNNHHFPYKNLVCSIYSINIIICIKITNNYKKDIKLQNNYQKNISQDIPMLHKLKLVTIHGKFYHKYIISKRITVKRC